ncbi:MAG: DNA-binding protein [Treponema sp.]|nr:DNA-binding protein [Treponema sp.]
MDIRSEYAVSEIGRTLIGRLLPGTDLVPGILSICAESGIRFGYVASLIGSLERVRFIYVNRSPRSRSGFVFTKPRERGGPLEILSAQGTLGEEEGGSPFLHLHALLCDEKDRIFGGHVLETGCPVLATVEVVIRETRGIRLIRGPDEETGVSLFRVSSGF